MSSTLDPSPSGAGATDTAPTDTAPTDVAPLDPAEFRRRYLERAATWLPDRGAAELDQLAADHLAFGLRRRAGEILVRVRTVDEHRCAVEVVTADAPYLVDSLQSELRVSGHSVQNILHPQLIVSRDRDGRLLRVYDLPDTAELPEGAVAESWMHAEVSTVPRAEQQELADAVHGVLTDVHHAVDDAPGLYALVRRLADTVSEHPGQFDRETSAEAGSLLRWLADGNFMILGHVSYSANALASSATSGEGPPPDPDAGGVLRGGGAHISALELTPAFRSGGPVVVFKSALTSTVLRADRFDCVTVVAPTYDGESARVHVFLGLFSETGDVVGRVPVLRKRIRDVLAQAGVRANSYTGRQLVAALRTLPRDELLEADFADLAKLATLVANRSQHGGVGVFSRLHLNRDFISVLVYLPADRFGPETTRRVRLVVGEAWPGALIARDVAISELGLARLHFLITLRSGAPVPTPDYRDVEARIAEVTRSWGDDLADLLLVATGDTLAEAGTSADGAALMRRYGGAFPEGYKQDFTAETAVRDIRRLEQLPEVDGLAFALYTPPPDEPAQLRLKMLRTGSHISLARVLPMLSHLGMEVLDERPYELERGDGRPAWIYDFGLRLPAGVQLEPSGAHADDVLESLRRLWRGDAEPDGFNALVLRARLDWRQVTVLRAYAKYLRQAGTPFSQGYIEQTLVEHPSIAARLVEVFEARFDPARQPHAAGAASAAAGPVTGGGPGAAGGPAAAVPGPVQPDPATSEVLIASVEESLGQVASLDQDRILRALLGLITATLRTNVFRDDARIGAEPARVPAGAAEHGSDGALVSAGALAAADEIRPAMAFKLDPHRIDGLPEPRPRFEIWVYSPRVEGVHLRFGLVARGGLRWSDRREDFRTEVLGLVKAQMVKNAVIVPVGAKGGFVVKRPPADTSDREALSGEAVACYRTFISSLLDVTDNYVTTGSDRAQVIAAPPQVVRYDADDPYLVVAADKGTATFSDIANAIALRRGFWLGDAFASGGSVGYDHKAMGITARGAWESVRYHFRERGLDTQSEDFTVVGIGDMSGDVFGNGMLLSEHIRLVAAFDHRHIFLDPDPDATISFAERQRLFDRPRSSWADYDTALISDGGGVYPRTMKSVPVSGPVAAALGLSEVTTALTPAQLMHAILVADVDLLWNGGIGTYVKASTESDAQVGDKANDVLRANAADLRCRVIGEGGNLGCTQLGRIEFARAGGGINTDAIDNSAGVDTSDHEVNIKILLDRMVAAGSLAAGDRNPMLAAATDEVAEDVLTDNYQQNVLLGLERRLAVPMVSVYGRLIRDLERSGHLDRALEFLPTDKEMAQLDTAGLGLVSPQLAVLAAYVKITLTQELEASDLPDDAWFAGALRSYFPQSIAARFADDLTSHPLSREIITTGVVNDMVNRAGTTFVFRALEEAGTDATQIARAYAVARQVFDLEEIWAELEALDNVVPTDAQDAAYFDIRRMLDRVTRWLIDLRYPITDVGDEIERFRPVVRAVSPDIVELLRGDERQTLADDTARLVDLGMPQDLAIRVATLLTAFLLLDVVEIAETSGSPAQEVADLHFALSEHFSVDRMLTAITALPRDDRWSALARAAQRHDVYAALASITLSVLRASDPALPAAERMANWERANSERVARARGTLAEALSRETPDLATLSVALRVMRGLPT